MKPTRAVSFLAGAPPSGERRRREHTDLPAHARDLQGRVAFAWRAMDAFLRRGRTNSASNPARPSSHTALIAT
jgi:hypothetical protein